MRTLVDLPSLRGKIVMRVAGDLHNYMRHSRKNDDDDESSKKRNGAQELIVSGGGGAFLHPTHLWPDSFAETNAEYVKKRAYPDNNQSRVVGLLNLGRSFRQLNSKFDFVGASIYFGLICEVFPRCGVGSSLLETSSPLMFLKLLGMEVLEVVYEIFAETYVPLATAVFALVVTFLFAPAHKGRRFRVLLGGVHALAHLVAAAVLIILFELVVESAIVDGHAGTGFHSSYDTYARFESRFIPARLRSTGPALDALKIAFGLVDVVEHIATTRVAMCVSTTPNPERYRLFESTPSFVGSAELLSRAQYVGFYVGSFLFFSVVSSVVVSSIIGTYLYVSSEFFHVHWNEAYSSLRFPHYKHFLRFHIDRNGDLNMYVLGFDEVCTKWTYDRLFRTTESRMKMEGVDDENDPSVASFGTTRPSKWIPRRRRDNSKLSPTLVDYCQFKGGKSKYIQEL